MLDGVECQVECQGNLKFNRTAAAEREGIPFKCAEDFFAKDFFLRIVLQRIFCKGLGAAVQLHGPPLQSLLLCSFPSVVFSAFCLLIISTVGALYFTSPRDSSHRTYTTTVLHSSVTGYSDRSSTAIQASDTSAHWLHS